MNPWLWTLSAAWILAAWVVAGLSVERRHPGRKAIAPLCDDTFVDDRSWWKQKTNDGSTVLRRCHLEAGHYGVHDDGSATWFGTVQFSAKQPGSPPPLTDRHARARAIEAGKAAQRSPEVPLPTGNAGHLYNNGWSSEKERKWDSMMEEMNVVDNRIKALMATNEKVQKMLGTTAAEASGYSRQIEPLRNRRMALWNQAKRLADEMAEQ
jgi:hypothetical protein